MRTEGRPVRAAVASAICSGAVRRRRPLREPAIELAVRVGVEIVRLHGARVAAVPFGRLMRGHHEIDQHPHRDPGPRSRELLERGAARCAEPLQVYLPVFAAEALNSTITDVDGNTFIDFAGGRRRLQRRPQPPARRRGDPGAGGRFIHTDFTVVPYAGYVELAERLGELAPFAGRRARLLQLGAEAVENASRSRARHRPAGVIAFEAPSTAARCSR
jgi:hypothetical protein